MSEERKPQYEYCDDPVNFGRAVNELGAAKVAEMIGYTVNSVRQMADGRTGVRQFIEWGFSEYYEAKEIKANTDSIFVFVCKNDSEAFKTLNSVAKAVGITITEL